MRMTVVAALEMHIWQIDFVSTYLNSKLEHIIYIRPLSGFLRGEDNTLYLKKMLLWTHAGQPQLVAQP